MGVAGIDDFAGRDGYVEFTRRWTEDFEEFALEPEQIVGADDDRVVVTTHTRGAGKGSGATVDMRTAWVVTLEAGRIVNVVLSWSRTMHSKPWDCGSSPRPKFGRRGSSAFRATSS